MKQVKKLYGLARAYRKLPWLLGDAINRSEDRVSSKHLDVLRFSDSQLYDFARVAALFPPHERLDYKLPWSYFRDAGADPEIARKLLAAAYRNNWSREEMRACRKWLLIGMEEENAKNKKAVLPSGLDAGNSDGKAEVSTPEPDPA